MEFAPFLRTAAGLNATAEEIARWIIAVQQGRLLREKSSLTTLWTPGVLKDGQRSVWGIGWPVFERPKHRVYLAYGGAKAAFAVYPDDDLAIVILTNLQGGMPEQFIDKVAAYYVPDMDAKVTGG
jgi:CubicO group peptidase (beta-lactamase class C family)